MVSSGQFAAARRRRGEGGFTLIETLVSVVVLAIIGGVVATLFSVGLSIIKPGGPADRMLGAHDLMVIEQALGQDAARSACIQLPPSGTKFGSCSAKFALFTCPAADLCFAWPQLSDSSCHVADYVVGASTTAGRKEYVAGVASPVSTTLLAREIPVSLSLGSVVAATPSGETYGPWVRSLPVTVTAVGLLSAPSQVVTLHPVATDPAGAAAAVTSGGNPC